jgi:hypothetical protein
MHLTEIDLALRSRADSDAARIGAPLRGTL